MESNQIKKNQKSDCRTCNCSGRLNDDSSEMCNVLVHEKPEVAYDHHQMKTNTLGQELCDNITQLIHILNENLNLGQKTAEQIEYLQAPACPGQLCGNSRCKKASRHRASETKMVLDLFSHNSTIKDLKQIGSS